jgi:hypothetical protein
MDQLQGWSRLPAVRRSGHPIAMARLRDRPSPELCHPGCRLPDARSRAGQGFNIWGDIHTLAVRSRLVVARRLPSAESQAHDPVGAQPGAARFAGPTPWQHCRSAPPAGCRLLKMILPQLPGLRTSRRCRFQTVIPASEFDVRYCHPL